jgi:hypothetical protein
MGGHVKVISKYHFIEWMQASTDLGISRGTISNGYQRITVFLIIVIYCIISTYTIVIKNYS